MSGDPASERAALSACGFDPARYVALHPDLQAQGLAAGAAAEHFLACGAAEGREAPVDVDLSAARSALRAAPLDADRRRLLLRAVALCEQRRQPRHPPEVSRTLPLLEAGGAYAPLLVVGDSHAAAFTVMGFVGDVLPLPFICSAGSARGLGNAASISGYGARVRELLAAAPGASALFLFGQVDVEFVYDYRRLRRGAVRFEEADFLDLARSTADAYFAFLRSVSGGLARAVVCSIFPPALGDDALAAGYDNGHVNQLEASDPGDLRQALARLERPDLRGRTALHARFNAELAARARAHGVGFLDLFTPLLGSDGLASPLAVGAPRGADHHLDFGAPFTRAVTSAALRSLDIGGSAPLAREGAGR